MELLVMLPKESPVGAAEGFAQGPYDTLILSMPISEVLSDSPSAVARKRITVVEELELNVKFEVVQELALVTVPMVVKLPPAFVDT